MNAGIADSIEKAYFISPIVNMEKLIGDMMLWACVTPDELQDRKTIETDFGENLSWDYLTYVKEHPIKWEVPTSDEAHEVIFHINDLKPKLKKN